MLYHETEKIALKLLKEYPSADHVISNRVVLEILNLFPDMPWSDVVEMTSDVFSMMRDLTDEML